jgi:hypothetical protein
LTAAALGAQPDLQGATLLLAIIGLPSICFDSHRFIANILYLSYPDPLPVLARAPERPRARNPSAAEPKRSTDGAEIGHRRAVFAYLWPQHEKTLKDKADCS